MQTLHIIGDNDSPLAIPVRFSDNNSHNDNEKIWATLQIGDSLALLKALSRRLHTPFPLNSNCHESPQHIIGAIKLLLDDGDMAEQEFRLDMFDWYVPGTVTTFSRTYAH